MKKRNTIIVVLLAVVVAAGIGCTTPIKYDLTDVSLVHPDEKTQSMKVAVAPLRDLRPMQERKPPMNRDKYQTSDTWFEGKNVGKGISEALAAHFNHVQLFKAADVVDESAEKPSKDVTKKMKELGYDALFTGSVTHFTGAGYPTTLDKTAGILAMIPATIIVTIPMMLAQKNKNEAFVEIIDVQLTSTTSGRLLWKGSFSKKVEMEYADAVPARAAKDTLKEVAKEMVMELETLKIK